MSRIQFSKGDLPRGLPSMTQILVEVEGDGYTRYVTGLWTTDSTTKEGFWYLGSDGPLGTEKVTGWALLNPPDIAPHVRHNLKVALRGVSHFGLVDSLRFRGFQTDCTEEDLYEALLGALEPLVSYAPKPRSYSTHEECLDCDMGPHYDPDDPEEWLTHCHVCNEYWPCPEAGQIDMEAISRDQEEFTRLRDKDVRTDTEEAMLHGLLVNLTAAGYLP